jgi:2-dehydropantoate 2-reductase
MNITIVGSGGVGGLLGALLSRAGANVSFIARGAHLAALGTDGLQVDGTIGTFSTGPLRASDGPSTLGPADAVLVAVKAWQVSALASSLRPLVADGGIVVPLQNGLEARDRLADALGADRVVGGLCHMISFIERPGLVRQSGGAPSVTVGEWSGGGSARLDRLTAWLSRAGIGAAVAPSIQAALWEKALFVEALGAVGAAVRLPVGAWRGISESRALLVGAMRETDAVARAGGVELGEAAVGRALARIDSLPADASASMQRDLAAGRPSELDDQTGAIVRFAMRRNVAVPIHEALLGALVPHERDARRAASQ